MRRRGGGWAWLMAVLLLGAGCDDGASDPEVRASVRVTGQVRLDGSPASATVTLEDLSGDAGGGRALVVAQTDAQGRYTLETEVDVEVCASLYVSVLVTIVRDGASGQVGGSEATRGCGEKTLDFSLAWPA